MLQMVSIHYNLVAGKAYYRLGSVEQAESKQDTAARVQSSENGAVAGKSASGNMK